VRFHVREIYHRLGVHNRVQAARILEEQRHRS
jgi:DNA-binding NarL/FixJ family response regulator